MYKTTVDASLAVNKLNDFHVEAPFPYLAEKENSPPVDAPFERALRAERHTVIHYSPSVVAARRERQRVRPPGSAESSPRKCLDRQSQS